MGVLVRIGKSTCDRLRTVLFSRYPDLEWATFALSGWTETEHGLVISISRLVEPRQGELNPKVGNAQFMEPYTLRMALESETTPLAVTVIHSHPESFLPLPSRIDDDMDRYYADYFSGFAPDRPYASLIFSTRHGELLVGGRVFWKSRWLQVDEYKIENTPVTTVTDTSTGHVEIRNFESVRRLADAFGEQAAGRLKDATVAVVGASGTGSAAIEILARAGIGHLIIVDPDRFAPSNLERLHGSTAMDVKNRPSKVSLARRHVKEINPDVRVTAIVGRLPQRKVLEQVLQADAVLGCTDSNAARVALADLAWRYCVPTLDVGVKLEGASGNVSGLIVNLVRFGPGRPCALCQRMYDPRLVTQELMTDEEKARCKEAAERARSAGGDPNRYWVDYPQLNTVGFLTSAASSMATGYVIGALAGRFDVPFERIQFDLSKPLLDTIDHFFPADPSCSCQTKSAWGDCASIDAIITAPSHWPDPEIV